MRQSVVLRSMDPHYLNGQILHDSTWLLITCLIRNHYPCANDYHYSVSQSASSSNMLHLSQHGDMAHSPGPISEGGTQSSVDYTILAACYTSSGTGSHLQLSNGVSVLSTEGIWFPSGSRWLPVHGEWLSRAADLDLVQLRSSQDTQTCLLD